MNPLNSPLLTDLYQFNMIQAYLDHGETKTAVFEFFVRKLPPRRGFLIAAGLEQVLDFSRTFASRPKRSIGLLALTDLINLCSIPCQFSLYRRCPCHAGRPRVLRQ